MRRIALHEYLSQIEGLLDDNRLPEAAAHCHFVLQQYPRHITTYRLYGRALLEQQLYEDAIDVFERLLGADPEDLISHAGLALAYSESRDLERAIWHMERAYEIDPYNRAVQDELRKLYIARDGDAPPRLTLTRAALARLHLRAGIFRQAVGEFSRLVAESPERSDLQLALAETLYLDSKLNGSAGLCQKVIENLPFCIKANAILADVLLREERVDEAREYLRRVQSLTMLDRTYLDPDTLLGLALGNARISLPEVVQVEILEDASSFSRESTRSMTWSERTSADLVDGEGVPDWLQEVGSPEGLLVPDSLDQVAVDSESEQLQLADWLDEAAAIASVISSDESEATSDVLADESDETNGLDQGSPTTDIEAIVLELSAGEDDTSAEDHDTDLAPEIQTVVAQDDSRLNSEDKSSMGLDELRAQIDSVDENEPVMADAGVPDWLDELSESSEGLGELPSWLHEVVGLETDEPVLGETDGKTSKKNAEGVIAKDREAPPIETTLPDSAEAIGRSNREDEYDVFLESETLEADSHSTIPDWLLEGDEVLEELPQGLVHSEVTDDLIAGNAGDETETWLDELTAQLSSQEDSTAGKQDDSIAVSDED